MRTASGPWCLTTSTPFSLKSVSTMSMPGAAARNSSAALSCARARARAWQQHLDNVLLLLGPRRVYTTKGSPMLYRPSPKGPSLLDNSSAKNEPASSAPAGQRAASNVRTTSPASWASSTHAPLIGSASADPRPTSLACSYLGYPPLVPPSIQPLRVFGTTGGALCASFYTRDHLRRLRSTCSLRLEA